MSTGDSTRVEWMALAPRRGHVGESHELGQARLGQGSCAAVASRPLGESMLISILDVEAACLLPGPLRRGQSWESKLAGGPCISHPCPVLFHRRGV